MTYKRIQSIYVAGKMANDGWRAALFDSGEKYGRELRIDPGVDSQDEWPKYSRHTVCGLRYTGPFFVDLCGGHGYHAFEGDEHGCNIQGTAQHGEVLYGGETRKRRADVQSWCFDAIARADLIFARIDEEDCYGTIAEIGYARALGKLIWIATRRENPDLWFVYTMADRVYIDPLCNGRHLKDFLHGTLEYHHRRNVQFDSPIEQAFWDAWYDYELTEHTCLYRPNIISQYPLGKFRVDFAHLETKTAIELDGHATHSSPDAIASDRKRQREIEMMGWHVIRFGGKEVYSDASHCVREACKILEARHIALLKSSGSL